MKIKVDLGFKIGKTPDGEQETEHEYAKALIKNIIVGKYPKVNLNSKKGRSIRRMYDSLDVMEENKTDWELDERDIDTLVPAIESYEVLTGHIQNYYKLYDSFVEAGLVDNEEEE